MISFSSNLNVVSQYQYPSSIQPDMNKANMRTSITDIDNSIKQLFVNQINKILSMTSSPSPSPQLGKSTYSNATRREVLWNVVQPGDPYDIRKSMISKLPGENEYFMGDNLQVVCLFQSAEIERLSQFLQDYKFRYREVERRELDRHSYQIQIKQLTQQLVDEKSTRSQMNKLKDFIKKQTFQIQQLKSNRFQIDNNLRANYQSALIQIDSLKRENDILKSEKDKFVIQVNSFTARIQAMQSTRERELRQLYNKYADENKYVIQNETKSLKTRYESEISRLQFEIKRLKEFNQAKNQQINLLSGKNRKLILQIEQLQSGSTQHDQEYVKKLEERFTLMGQQIQRLNLRIKQSTSKIDESARNELYWKDKHKHLQEDYKSIQIRYRQATDKFNSLTLQFEKLSGLNQHGNYEDQIKRLNNEIKRLEEQRSNQSQRYKTLQRKYSELEYNYSKISVIERENIDLKDSQANSQQLKRRLAQYETKVALLSQQIQRLNSLARNSTFQKQGYDELKINFQEFRRRSIQSQRNLTQKYESQMQRKVLEYQSRLARFAQESGNQFQVRLQAINRQVQKLNQYLKQKTEQSEQNKRRIRELQNSIHQKYQIEVNRQYSSYEATIKQLKNINDQLNRKYRQSSTTNTKVAEYENKIALFTQQVQRLNYSLKMKVDELQGLRRVNRQLQMKSQNNGNLDIQINKRIYVYEENQSKLTRQNEDLKRRLQQIVEMNRRLRQYEDKIRMMTQDNERLNLNLRQKIEALNRSEQNLRNLSQEVQGLRRNRLEIQSSFNQKLEYDKMETSRKFTNYEQSLSSIQRQYEQLRRRMMDMGNDSNRKVSEYQNKIVLLTQQIQRLNQTFKIKINDYENAINGLRNQLQLSRRQNKELQINITQKYELETSRKIGMYEQNMSGLTRELQELRRRINESQNTIRKKNQQISTLENRYRVVSQEYQSFKFQVKSFETQVNRSQSSFEQNLTRLTREHDEAKRRLIQYENRFALLTQENERLNVALRTSQQEQQNLRRTMNQLKIEITQKYQIQTSRKINGYQQNLNLLNREKQEFRRKMTEYENLISNSRRQNEQKNRKLLEWENKYRQLVQQHQGLNNKFRELQITVTQKYEIQTTRKITGYEQNIQNLGRQLENMKMKLIEYENMRINYQKQINRLNGLMKNSQSEVTRQFTIYQQNISNLNVQIEDYKRKLMNTDQTSKNQGIQLEQLRRRLKQFGDINRTVHQYENQFVLIRQQLQRVNINLKSKVQELNISQNKLRSVLMENEDLKRKIKEVQISISNKYQFQLNQNMGNVKRQVDDLRRKISQLENKNLLVSQQLERLNNMYKIKIQELNQSELRGRNWQQQIENLRRRIQDNEKSSNQRFQSEFTRTISVYEQNMATITREYEQYKRQSARRIAELESKVAFLSQQLERVSQGYRSRGEQSEMRLKNATQQIQRLQRTIRELEMNSGKRQDIQKTTIISTYEQKFIIINRQLEEHQIESNRKYLEYENRILAMTRELERVNNSLIRKDDTGNLQRNILQLTQENENLRRQVKESELQFNQRYQLQISRKVSTYEQNFITLKSELENFDRKNKQLLRRIAQDQGKIALMSQQIERLNLTLRTKVDEAKHYQLELQKLRSNSFGASNTNEIQQLNLIIKQKSEQILILKQKLNLAQAGQSTQVKQLQSSYSLIQKQYQNSKKHLEQYEQSIRKLYSEFERLQVIINELKAERQTLFDKNHGLLKQIDRLTLQNKDQQSQIYELRLKYSDEASLQKRINQHMALMVVLFAEIETLRQRVKDKEKEVQQVRRSSLAPLKA